MGRHSTEAIPAEIPILLEGPDERRFLHFGGRNKAITVIYGRR